MAEPYLYRGDCMPVLEDLPSAGIALVTDSPYGIDWVSKDRHKITQKRAMFPPIAGDDQPFDPAHLLRFETVVLWGANHFADRLPASSGWLVWDKRNGTGSDHGSDCELAWTNRPTAARLYSYLWRGIVKESQKIPDESSFRLHPHQKPVALFKWVIEQLDLPAGTLIVDPYMGSGSCLVAAIQLGYPVFGCEIDPGFFATAARRVGTAQLQAPLLKGDRSMETRAELVRDG